MLFRSAGQSLVLHLTVDDLPALWAAVQRQGLAARYGVAVEPPQERAWGRLDMQLSDPSGVQWKISQRLEAVE